MIISKGPALGHRCLAKSDSDAPLGLQPSEAVGDGPGLGNPGASWGWRCAWSQKPTLG